MLVLTPLPINPEIDESIFACLEAAGERQPIRSDVYIKHIKHLMQIQKVQSQNTLALLDFINSLPKKK